MAKTLLSVVQSERDDLASKVESLESQCHDLERQLDDARTARDDAERQLEGYPEDLDEYTENIRNEALASMTRVIHECLRERGRAFEDVAWPALGTSAVMQTEELIRRVS